MTSQAKIDAAHGFSGHEVADFTSRRTLVLRRFARNRFAVASLTLLVLLFVGCYALPAFLPYSYEDLDFAALLQPPSARHWLGTNALGQDLLAQILRGMQKSMLIGVCVAVISTGSDKFRAGQRVVLPVMDGHRNTNDTDCPGIHLYRELDQIRALTAHRISRFDPKEVKKLKAQI